MGFTSEVFLFIFFPSSILIFLLTHAISKGRADNITLVVLSLIFYSWGSIDSLLIFIVLIVGVWLFGNCIYYARRESSPQKLKLWTTAGITILSVYLFAAKYLSFLMTQIGYLIHKEIKIPLLIIPLGLSFVVFEAISYFVDIYRGDALPGSLVDTALFLSLFTKLVSGPIVLWKDFEGQLKQRKVSAASITAGIDRIIIGFAKKALIADVLGSVIVVIQGQLGRVTDRYTMWLYAILYFFQIYYDFSGYSDIAIGISRIFGFEINENFNFPYISLSITEFWRRWHISLGTWFREYVYIPLGGNRTRAAYLNLGVVFLLTGIWHGADWTFFIWGIYNGIIVIAERFLMKKKWYGKIPKVIRWFITMVLVGLGWVVFMSGDINTAITNITNMFVPRSGIANYTWRYYMSVKLFVLLVIAAVGSVIGFFAERIKKAAIVKTRGFVICQRCALIILFIISLLFIVNSSYSPFLYFQF